jgi:hypothetical protein
MSKVTSGRRAQSLDCAASRLCSPAACQITAAHLSLEDAGSSLHLIRDDEDYGRHVEYCYINPVKHGLVTRVRDWPFSSFHRDVAAGLFPQDWAGEFEALGEFGEARGAQ